jgi:hypothetical protein
MANLVAFDQFIIDQIDLNYYVREYFDDALEKNANLTFNGVAYSDWYWVNGFDGVADLELDFVGTGFAVNAAGEFTAGTVNAVAELDLEAETFLWFIQGISLPATAIYSAAFTQSNADELALVVSALEGNDLIVLSSFADKMNGYAGNDFIRGNGGNDDLDGGSGVDTAAFAGARLAYTITPGSAGVITVTGPDGTDTLRNIEFAQFNDQTVQLNPGGGPSGRGQLYLNPGNQTYGPVPGGDITTINGSNLAERVTLAADANVAFDPSFVRGNDVIVIQGSSANYSIASNVAGVTISSSNGAQFRIPAFGAGGGLQIQFNNGVAQLATDDGGNSFELVGAAGVQEITSTSTSIGTGFMTFA